MILLYFPPKKSMRLQLSALLRDKIQGEQEYGGAQLGNSIISILEETWKLYHAILGHTENFMVKPLSIQWFLP